MFFVTLISYHGKCESLEQAYTYEYREEGDFFHPFLIKVGGHEMDSPATELDAERGATLSVQETIAQKGLERSFSSREEASAFHDRLQAMVSEFDSI